MIIVQRNHVTADGGAAAVVAIEAHMKVAIINTLTAFEGALCQFYWIFLPLSALFFGGEFLFFFHLLHPALQYLSPIWGIICEPPPISGDLDQMTICKPGKRGGCLSNSPADLRAQLYPFIL